MITKEAILDMVSRETGVSVADILLRKDIPGAKKQEVVAARYVAMYLCRLYALRCVGYERKWETIESLGKFFNRNHTDVLYGIREVDKLRSVDSEYNRKLEEIENQISKL
jgi:chromosomal replication initiator protein